MVQKNIWMRYFMFGISVVCVSFFTHCKIHRDYSVKGTYVFMNSTEYVMEVKASPSFFLKPKQSHTIEVITDGAKDVTHKSYSPPFWSAILIYDHVRCDTIQDLGEGVLGIDNYRHEKIADRHYMFLYTFTETDFKKSILCK